MKPSSLVTLGAVVLFAVAGGIALKYAHLTRQAEIALGVLTTEQSRVSAEVRRADDRLAAAGRARGATPRSSAAVVGARFAAGSGSQPDAAIADKVKDPKVQLIELAAARARGASSYGWFFRKAGLTPAQIEKFQDNLAARDEQDLDLDSLLRTRPAAASAGSPEIQATVTQLRSQAEAQYQASQQELLGAQAYAQLRDYDRALPAQSAVSALAGNAVLAGVPLTERQAEQLTEVVASTSGDYQKGGVASAASIDWDAVDAQAPSILSATQLNVLKTMATPRDGRFWNQFDSLRTKALQAEAVSRPTPTVSGN
jgi:hypothetical protein